MAFTDDHVPLPVTHTTAPVYNRWALTNTDPSNLVKPDGYRRDSAFFGPSGGAGGPTDHREIVHRWEYIDRSVHD